MENIFFDRFFVLCKENGETPNAVAKKIGASSGSVTAWKRGTAPRNTTLYKIADHFGVSTDYLLGKDQRTDHTVKSAITDDEIKFALFGGDRDITDAMYNEVRQFAAFVKRREEEKKK